MKKIRKQEKARLAREAKAKKKEVRGKERGVKLQELDEYNARHYYSDLEYIGRLYGITDSTRDWIEMRMYELRASANKYETNMAKLLLMKKEKFIHQAPFVFFGKKIYFADFYLPEKRIVIEVDGIYHKSGKQLEYDKDRDAAFRGIKILTIRVDNAETMDLSRLELRLSQYIKWTSTNHIFASL